MKVAVLGGTGEARELADRLRVLPSVTVSVSLARDGGFGGVDGLVKYLRGGGYDALIDASHPFATTITVHAIAAAKATGLAHLVLRRPGWNEQPGDDWRRVPSFDSAAVLLRSLAPQTVFLAIGRNELARFADDDRHRYVLRMIDAPRVDEPMPANRTIVLRRGPFELDGERELLRAHAIDLIVTKDSGGTGATAKLDAARELGRPVIMIDRPPAPAEAMIVSSVPAALGWLFSSSR